MATGQCEYEDPAIRSLMDVTASASAQRLVQQQPPEILRIIFDHCFGLADQLEPSITHGPNSPWSRTLRDKKSIVRVCKMWWSVGVEFLYKHVALRRVGQIPALVRTLEEATEMQLSHLISSITVGCAVPDICHDAFVASLDCLLAKCLRLTTVTYAPMLLDDNIHNHMSDAHDLILSLIAPHLRFLTHLSFGEDVHISSPTLLEMLRDMTQLKSLAMVLGPPDLVPMELEHAELEPSVEVISLEHLEHLSLKLVGRGTLDSLTVQHRLNFPKLYSVQCSYLDTTLWRDVAQLLACKGSTLRSLSVKCLLLNCESCHKLQPVIDQCPILQHLVFTSDLVFPSSHSTIRWIDVLAWGENFCSWPPPNYLGTSSIVDDYLGASPRAATNWRFQASVLTSTAFPALERVRLIDPELLTMPHLDLAGALHPATEGNASMRIHVPGATVLETFDMVRVDDNFDIIQREDNWSDEDDELRAVDYGIARLFVEDREQSVLEESDEDGPYVPPSMESESSYYDSDDEHMEGDAEGPNLTRVDVVELLQIFNHTQEVDLWTEGGSNRSTNSSL